MKSLFKEDEFIKYLFLCITTLYLGLAMFHCAIFYHDLFLTFAAVVKIFLETC